MPEKKYQVSAHTRYFIRIHIVWIVKRRREILDNQIIAQRLTEVLNEIGNNHEIKLFEVGTDKDHLHIFCETLPKMSPAWIVNKLKGVSAHTLRKEFPGLKTGYLQGALWGTGYYAATVGCQNNAAAVRAYVRLQGKKADIKNYKQIALFE